jgi:hypothetical protein
MKSIEDKIALLNIYQPLVGKAPWNISLGYGSFLNFDFGEKIKEHGEWHLWIYCCAWKITHLDKKLVDNEDKSTMIEPALQNFMYQKLIEIDINPSLLETTFTFENEHKLTTTTIDFEDAEAWLLFTPDNKVLSLGPGSSWSYEDKNN